MSQYRERVVGVALAALFTGAPLLAAGPAAAEPVESGRSVVFRGAGVLGLTCAARPDTGTLTVPAETTVRVVNQTGHRARLTLDGVAQGEIRDDDSADVLFRRGPVTLSLRPNCVLSEESRSVRVEVRAAPRSPEPAPPPSPAAPGSPAPPAAPPAAGPQGAQPATGASPPAATGGGTLPDTGAGTRPSRGGGLGLPEQGARGTRSGVASATRAAMPVPGMPPGDDPVIVPRGAGMGLPAVIASAAAEPVAALAPITDTGRTGLLAVIATVCLAGVTAGAIRAIAAQRAYRARIA